MLKTRVLKKTYGDCVVLDELNMEVADGCVYGLIGSNGAGKSTLLRIIAGIMKPDLGCVTVDDVSIYENPDGKSQVLLISDDPYYFYNATLRDMMRFYKISYPQLDDAVYERLLRVFGLEDTTPMMKFSKGMKRQAFLILGLAIAPRFLLLDEAFDGLDAHIRLLFKKEITARIEDQQMTVIISSHNLRELETICDSFGFLEAGKLLTSGTMGDTLDQIHKIQLAFATPVEEKSFMSLDIMSLRIQSKIVNLVVRGDLQEIQPVLDALQPVMVEVLPVSLEELFIYEMEQKEGIV